jgi:hypothetical protein
MTENEIRVEKLKVELAAARKDLANERRRAKRAERSAAEKSLKLKGQIVLASFGGKITPVMVDKVTSEGKIVDTDGHIWSSFRALMPRESGFRPDWSKAPRWAKYWGMNSDGRAWWMDHRPFQAKADGRWRYCSTCRMEYDDSFMEGWGTSLQQRPEEMCCAGRLP